MIYDPDSLDKLTSASNARLDAGNEFLWIYKNNSKTPVQ
jgi:hypothetical protein